MDRHPLDVFSLLFGAVLTATGLMLVFVDPSPRMFDGDYLGPLALGFVGLVVLAVGMARVGRSGDPDGDVLKEPDSTEPVGDQD